MAISETHYRLLKELRDRELLPQGGRILEIGQANWYGDMNPQKLFDEYCSERIDDLTDPRLQYIARLCGAIESRDAIEIVRVLYWFLFGVQDRNILSIDLDPIAKCAIRHDLNDPFDAKEIGQFDVCFNHGTAEHIFNVANVFKVMHDATVEGGLMIHEAPFTGWVDHGFYCLQPTLFWDVAHANGYEIVRFALEHLTSRSVINVKDREEILRARECDTLPDNAMCWVAMRKGPDAPFKVPMQGVYAGTAGAEAVKAWGELR